MTYEAAPANPQNVQKWFCCCKSLLGKQMELCAGFSVFEGVCAKIGFPQWGDFCKCWWAKVFRMKLRAEDFFGFAWRWRFKNSGQFPLVSIVTTHDAGKIWAIVLPRQNIGEG